MTIKNKYGYLKLGIEIEYHKIPQCEENNIDPDFFACKLFNDNTKNIYNELTTNESVNNSSMINGNGKRCSYEIDPLFGNIYEDKNIWEKNIYGLMSTWINPDDENENSSLYSMDALNKELQWSTYISISKLIINVPNIKCDNYARYINSCINNYNMLSLIMRIPIVIKKKKPFHKESYNNNMTCDIINGWNLWAKFISYCNFNYSHLGLALELSNINNIDLSNIQLDVWKSEPVKLIIIPLDAFLLDTKTGYPYLPKKLKDFLIYFFRKNIEVLLITNEDINKMNNHFIHLKNEYCNEYQHNICNNEMDSYDINDNNNNNNNNNYNISNSIHTKTNNNYYLKCCIYYIKRLFMSIENFDNDSLFDSFYWDYLQIPLQPLKDNLSSQTYEVFEKDRKKYEQYELATSKYLSNWKKGKKINNKNKQSNKNKNNNNNNNMEEQQNDHKITIFVVGAGRGPLVDTTLSALQKNEITDYEIYAIEKNDSAIIILNNRVQTEEWKNVKVIHSDIRYLDIPKKADIIISELLGSFGDNELFPECMDGIKKFLKDDGISIPMNCVSYLEPISCSALYHKVMENNISGGNESFYVVNMYSYTKISQESSKECFFFQVPPIHTKQDNSHNYRYKNINFKIKMDTYIHGFLCYFKSQLYDDVYISIEPKTHTPNLHSWFPLYIPINKIQFLKKGQNLSFSIWRLTDHQKIWYEWCINEPITTSIHNYNARYFSIGR
ncbi:hypothetical protein PFUGPA_02553 [Plasmodium falciparum Palo Alto/Uganda]|uniref:Protein arginine N-methyltransferase n=2 Tax=Plasmodium falciparum TaxID=5833 RepID=W4IZE8_PLAFP|nr:hypothetical protein PFUGPA_02553 [Plasmodium falciparum Palo Alto/Uganda]ETW59373.1 hypothetical protein PFMC_04849 [Plasmodium falciparum CAMP/Malaysia]